MCWCSCGNSGYQACADRCGSKRDGSIDRDRYGETLGYRCCLGGDATAQQEQSGQPDAEQNDCAWFGDWGCAAARDRRKRAVNRIEDES